MAAFVCLSRKYLPFQKMTLQNNSLSQNSQNHSQRIEDNLIKTCMNVYEVSGWYQGQKVKNGTKNTLWETMKSYLITLSPAHFTLTEQS